MMTSELLNGWTITPNGDYFRQGYLVCLDPKTGNKVIYDSDGNLLVRQFKYYYLAVKFVNETFFS